MKSRPRLGVSRRCSLLSLLPSLSQIGYGVVSIVVAAAASAVAFDVALAIAVGIAIACHSCRTSSHSLHPRITVGLVIAPVVIVVIRLLIVSMPVLVIPPSPGNSLPAYQRSWRELSQWAKQLSLRACPARRQTPSSQPVPTSFS